MQESCLDRNKSFLYHTFSSRGLIMAVSKNSRTTVSTQHFTCSCGGEIVLKTMMSNGKLKNIAECSKCKRMERRPSDFR